MLLLTNNSPWQLFKHFGRYSWDSKPKKNRGSEKAHKKRKIVWKMFCYSILQSEQPEDIFSSTNCGSESDGVFSSVVSFSSSSSSSVKSGSSVGIWIEYLLGKVFHLILFEFDPTMLFRKSLLGRFPGAFTRPDMKIKKRVIMCWYDDQKGFLMT